MNLRRQSNDSLMLPPTRVGIIADKLCFIGVRAREQRAREKNVCFCCSCHLRMWHKMSEQTKKKLKRWIKTKMSVKIEMEFHLTTKTHVKIHGYLYFVIVVHAQSGVRVDKMPAKREMPLRKWGTIKMNVPLNLCFRFLRFSKLFTFRNLRYRRLPC